MPGAFVPESMRQTGILKSLENLYQLRISFQQVLVSARSRLTAIWLVPSHNRCFVWKLRNILPEIDCESYRTLELLAIERFDNIAVGMTHVGFLDVRTQIIYLIQQKIAILANSSYRPCPLSPGPPSPVAPEKIFRPSAKVTCRAPTRCDPSFAANPSAKT